MMSREGLWAESVGNSPGNYIPGACDWLVICSTRVDRLENPSIYTHGLHYAPLFLGRFTISLPVVLRISFNVLILLTVTTLSMNSLDGLKVKTKVVFIVSLYIPYEYPYIATNNYSGDTLV